MGTMISGFSLFSVETFFPSPSAELENRGYRGWEDVMIKAQGSFFFFL